MIRNALLLCFLLFFISSIYAQLGTEWEAEPVFNTNSKFWEDPQGLIYSSGSIMEPNVIGDWVYFEINEDGDRFNLFTRTVHCLETIQDRSRTQDILTFHIYPNPAIDALNIEVPEGYSQVLIFSIDGIHMETKKVNSQKFSFDLEGFNSGLYIIQCKGLNTQMSKLFVVE